MITNGHILQPHYLHYLSAKFQLKQTSEQHCGPEMFSHYFRDAKLPSSRYHLDLPLKSFYTEITELSLLE